MKRIAFTSIASALLGGWLLTVPVDSSHGQGGNAGAGAQTGGSASPRAVAGSLGGGQGNAQRAGQLGGNAATAAAAAQRAQAGASAAAQARMRAGAQGANNRGAAAAQNRAFDTRSQVNQRRTQGAASADRNRLNRTFESRFDDRAGDRFNDNGFDEDRFDNDRFNDSRLNDEFDDRFRQNDDLRTDPRGPRGLTPSANRLDANRQRFEERTGRTNRGLENALDRVEDNLDRFDDRFDGRTESRFDNRFDSRPDEQFDNRLDSRLDDPIHDWRDDSSVWDPNASIGVEAWRDRPVERSFGGTADRNRTSSRLDATRNARDPSRSQFRARSGAASRGLSTAADPRLDPSNRTYLGDDDLRQGVANDDFDRTRLDGWRDRPVERSIGGTADRSQRNSARQRAPMNGRGFNNGFAQEGRDSFRGGAAGAAANPASQRRQTGFRGVERENWMELNDGQFDGSTNQATQVLSNWLDRTARGLDRLNDRLNGRLEAETEQP